MEDLKPSAKVGKALTKDERIICLERVHQQSGFLPRPSVRIVIKLQDFAFRDLSSLARANCSGSMLSAMIYSLARSKVFF